MYFNLKMGEMKRMKVVSPPSKIKIFKYLKSEFDQKKDDWALGINLDHLPNKDYMIDLLFNINPGHKVFDKNYQWKTKRKIDAYKIMMPKQFLQDLPNLDPTFKK